MSTSAKKVKNVQGRLKEAALIVFAEKGYDDANIREIGELAKVNSAMIQYYFGGKEGLYREALRFVRNPAPQWILEMPRVPEPTELNARELAIELLRDYATQSLKQNYLRPHWQDMVAPEVLQAARILWRRVMEESRPSMDDFILDTLRPHSAYVDACVRAIRPDLDEEARFLMCQSFQGQLMPFRANDVVVRILRGAPYEVKDIERLVEHIMTFCLRGFGVA